ncbi:exodeoxyribonuclease III [Motiliproteus sediminis]|uniref:exodeoxyribonuclease III n=1 Tax=Motiliproteus sediminis TaxID=1468178 RepID=UPI001AF020D8|nr:exodeoxyribonuclease III [Motiliproteus sediminis]
MKIVSFNTNGIRARQHQLQALVEQHQPDVIGIQETKVSDEEFPRQAIESLGYHVDFHGQKGHYGVCLISRQPAIEIRKGFPWDSDDAQKRLIVGRYALANGQSLTVINGYFPQGENITHPTKFPAKERFYADLQRYLESEFSPDDLLLVMGDMNISPEDNDIGIGEVNRKRWLKTGKASFQPVEREWLQRLGRWGLTDTFRHGHPQVSDRFSWFDYRSRGFEAEPKRGLRIDLIMATPSMLRRCTGTGISYEIRSMEKPSDHAPIWAEFEL